MLTRHLARATLALGLALPAPLAAQTVTAEDRWEVFDIIAQMNHAIDAEDYDTYLTFYAEDAVFDPGFTPATTGLPPIRAFLEEAQAAGAITGKRHVATNIVIDGTADGLTADYYLSVFERQDRPALVATAFITDEFEEIDGVWKVTRHVTSIDPSLQAGQAGAD